jgi:proteic killer suppression protein
MRIAGFRNKGLERLWGRGEARGAARQHESKLRAMLTVIGDAENVAELSSVPGWHLHPLKGSRKGIWSLRLTRNYRLTFRVSGDVVSEIDVEDYH